jgi:hypothetical protein
MRFGDAWIVSESHFYPRNPRFSFISRWCLGFAVGFSVAFAVFAAFCSKILPISTGPPLEILVALSAPRVQLKFALARNARIAYMSRTQFNQTTGS